jgi:hypothetical protein
MKAGTADPEKTTIARYGKDKHLFAETDNHETTEELLEAVFFSRGYERRTNGRFGESRM